VEQFRNNQLKVLVATSVLSCGVNIPSVTHVVLFDFGAIDEYVHRVGRTARGVNEKGKALTFFEWYAKLPDYPQQFIDILTRAKQAIQPALTQLAAEVFNGRRYPKDAFHIPITEKGQISEWTELSYYGYTTTNCQGKYSFAMLYLSSVV
jgi:superfamily II DNA/RNA helicase